MPPHSKPKRPSGPAPRSPTDLASHLLGLLLASTDPVAAAVAIVDARRSGLGPSAAEVAAWIARVTKTTTTYAALVRVQNTLPEDVDLIDRIIDAAARERRALPLNEPWTQVVVWTEVSEEARWQFVREAVEDAANASQVAGTETDQHSALGRYFELVVPTLTPDPLARLEWWFDLARAVSRQRDTDLDFGSEAQGEVDEWISAAADSGSLPALMRLASLLQHPVWGASGPVEGWLDTVYERIGAALPPPRKHRRNRASKAAGE